MRNKRIATIVIICLLVTVLAATLAGCETPLTAEEGFVSMTDAIKNSLTQKTYFVKENKYSVKEKDDTTEYRFNIHEDNVKTTHDDTKVKFTIQYIKPLAISVNNSLEWTFGASLSSNIKPKDAKDSDYFQYLFYNVDGDMKKKVTTLDDYFKIPEVNEYLIANVLDELISLTMNDFVDANGKNTFESIKTGVIMSYTFVVNKEGHPYNGLTIKVQSMYNKISLIERNDSNKTRIDITYLGPKIDILSYDGMYKEKPILDME